MGEMTLEQVKADYLSGKTNYRYALIMSDSNKPYALSEKPFCDAEIISLTSYSFMVYGTFKMYTQIDFLE